MKNQAVNRRLQRLKQNFDRAHRLPQEAEILAHWARYLCILTSGLIEKSLVELLTEYIAKGSSPPIAGYAISKLEQLQNPKTQKIIDLLGAFKDEWRIAFQKFAEESGRKEAIDSVMANRHQIAHGEDSGVTIARVREYFDKCEEVLEHIEALCKA
jgi:hypothetical protein